MGPLATWRSRGQASLLFGAEDKGRDKWIPSSFCWRFWGGTEEGRLRVHPDATPGPRVG